MDTVKDQVLTNNHKPNQNQNPATLKSKHKRKLELIQEIQKAVNSWQSLVFRSCVLLFVVFVEIGLFKAVFDDKTISTSTITAITIIAVLPILVIRAFDITALNLTKDGFASSMLQNGQPKEGNLLIDNSAKVNNVQLKISDQQSQGELKINSEKYIQIEYEGNTYKVALVE